MTTSTRSLFLCGVVVVWMATMAPAAQASPFLLISGGGQVTQNYIPTCPFCPNLIPNGATGWGNEFGNGPLSIIVKDTTAPAGTPVTIWFSFVGSDSYFTNEFNAGNGALTWCHDGDYTCDPGYTAVTGPKSFTGPFAFTGSITAFVDSAIPFTFFANVNPGPVLPLPSGTGGLFENAHVAVFDFTNGFDFANFNQSGQTFLIGLTDGHFGGVGDDDHQDFMVLVSTEPVPEPTTLVLLGTGLVAVAVRMRRRR